MVALIKTILCLLVCGLLTACSTTTEQKMAARANWGLAPIEEKEKKVEPSPKPSPKPSKGLGSKKRTVRTTAYSHEENEPGAYGRLNAVGTTLRYGQMRSAASDWSRYPLGTQFKIVGQPHIYEIDDFGSALVGTGTIDIYKPTLSAMNAWGVRHVEIEILKWGSLEKCSDILCKRTHHCHCKAMYDSIQPKLKKR